MHIVIKKFAGLAGEVVPWLTAVLSEDWVQFPELTDRSQMAVTPVPWDQCHHLTSSINVCTWCTDTHGG